MNANDRANAPPFTKYLYLVRHRRKKHREREREREMAQGELLIDIYLIVPDGDIYTEFRGFKAHLLVPVLIVFLLPVRRPRRCRRGLWGPPRRYVINRAMSVVRPLIENP